MRIKRLSEVKKEQPLKSSLVSILKKISENEEQFEI